MLFLLLLSLFKNNYIVNDFILHVKDINSEGTLLTLCTSRSVPTAKYQQKIVHVTLSYHFNSSSSRPIPLWGSG